MALFVRNLTIVKLVNKSTKTNKFYDKYVPRRSLSASNSLHGRIVPFKLSDIGEGIREVTVKEWFVKPGDKVNQFDNVCEVQSDKASVTITSRYDGFIKSLRFKVDEIALVGQPLVDIELNEDDDDGDEEKKEKVKDEKDVEALKTSSTVDKNDEDDETRRERLLGKVLTTPAVRRIAIEKGIKLSEVVGTGKNGRILKEDLISFEVNEDHSSSESDDEKVPKIKTATKNDGEIRTVVPKFYAKHMWTTMTKSLDIPHFVYSDECDVTKLINYRNDVKLCLKERRGLSLTFMPFFVKAISKSLEKYPELNARLNVELKTVDVIPWHNISIAIDTPQGLVVPNVKNVQNLDIVEIAEELNRLQELAKKGSISPNDLSGGTFTLSNIGVIGGTYTKPVILSPQIAIGAIGRVQKLPRFDSVGNVIPADILSVSWSADHRVVDGVTIAKFSNEWRYYLENPSLLAING